MVSTSNDPVWFTSQNRSAKGKKLLKSIHLQRRVSITVCHHEDHLEGSRTRIPLQLLGQLCVVLVPVVQLEEEAPNMSVRIPWYVTYGQAFQASVFAYVKELRQHVPELQVMLDIKCPLVLLRGLRGSKCMSGAQKPSEGP